MKRENFQSESKKETCANRTNFLFIVKHRVSPTCNVFFLRTVDRVTFFDTNLEHWSDKRKKGKFQRPKARKKSRGRKIFFVRIMKNFPSESMFREWHFKRILILGDEFQRRKFEESFLKIES